MKKTIKQKLKEEINNEKNINLSNVEIKQEVRGLGDVFKKITDTLSIPTCEKCEERRQKLNKAYSFLRAVKRDITDEEIIYLKDIESSKKIDNSQKFVKIFNEVFGTNQTACDCPSLMRDLLSKLLMQIEYQNIK